MCKYCEDGVPASSLSEHEQSCADGYDQCAKCFEWVQRREWDEHQGTLHNLLVQRSPMRQRRQSESSSQPKPAEVVDASTMLPCEFCEGLVPFTKLLEHQAECVNPTNVRGSAGLRSPLMQPRFGGTLARSQSVLSVRHSWKPDDFDLISYCLTSLQYEGHGERSPRPTRVDRSSSVRESTTSRASEEPRMSTRLLLRQSSFTERSIRRRSESLTRQSSFTDRSYIRYGMKDFKINHVHHSNQLFTDANTTLHRQDVAILMEDTPDMPHTIASTKVWTTSLMVDDCPGATVSMMDQDGDLLLI